jgi:hypothetical protein
MTQIEMDALRMVVWKLPKIAESLEQIAQASSGEFAKIEKGSLEAQVILFALRFLESNLEDDVLETIEESCGLNEKGIIDIIRKLHTKIEVKK